MTKYKQINIKEETHLKIKVLASKHGESIIKFLDRLIDFYYNKEMNNRKLK